MSFVVLTITPLFCFEHCQYSVYLDACCARFNVIAVPKIAARSLRSGPFRSTPPLAHSHTLPRTRACHPSSAATPSAQRPDPASLSPRIRSNRPSVPPPCHLCSRPWLPARRKERSAAHTTHDSSIDRGCSNRVGVAWLWLRLGALVM